ncbi:hypothetical protein TNIN_320251 [Trichonephila inaurata madagascariensis]|uniref:Glucose-methanol-choline oxidoreductase C-terminal domain-containing protein n=1 Tax=Trichonephila inaurata madagascariensis TaxID=2747483 RepID=A0A8X6YUZ5_9ARAC|nr:hypothetical protein TNIN_320251 [Trichonephila inaurata madagascariensis]
MNSAIFKQSKYLSLGSESRRVLIRKEPENRLGVKGIRNLRVMDASVMPNIPGGNTNGPTMMVAEKASDIIKQTICCESDNDMPSILPEEY